MGPATVGRPGNENVPFAFLIHNAVLLFGGSIGGLDVPGKGVVSIILMWGHSCCESAEPAAGRATCHGHMKEFFTNRFLIATLASYRSQRTSGPDW